MNKGQTKPNARAIAEEADSPAPPRAARLWGRGWLWAGGLAVLAFLPSLNYPLLLDDPLVTFADARLDPPLDWRALVATPLYPDTFPPAPVWRPALHVSLAFNRLTTGHAPAGYRWVNLLLHAVATGLLWGVARRLGAGGRAATFAAVLFALHPVHAEAVVGIVGRAELLMTVGVLLTLGFGIDSVRSGRLTALGLAAAAYALAFFAKEQGFFALPILGVVWLTLREAPRPEEAHSRPDGNGSDAPPGDETGRRHSPRPARLPWRRLFVSGLLLCAVAMAGISLRTRLFGLDLGFGPANLDPLDNPLVEIDDPRERTATALRMFGRAVALTVLPVRLSPDYSAPGVPVGIAPRVPAVASAAVLGVLLVLGGVLWRPWATGALGRGTAGRAAGIGILWFLIAELPVSNLFTLNGTIFGERMLYLPSAGACLALGIGLDVALKRLNGIRRGGRRRAAAGLDEARALRLAAVGAVGVLLVGSWSAARPWRSEEALFTQAVRVVPRSAKAHYGLGLALKAEGDREGAFEHISRAVGLWPRFAKAWHEMGVLLLEEGDPAAAEEALRRALALRPRLAESHNSLGNALALQERWREALARFETYRRLDAGGRYPEALEAKIRHTRTRAEAAESEKPPRQSDAL